MGKVNAELVTGEDWASMQVSEDGHAAIEVFVRTPSWEPGIGTYALAIRREGGGDPVAFVELDADTLEVVKLTKF